MEGSGIGRMQRLPHWKALRSSGKLSAAERWHAMRPETNSHSNPQWPMFSLYTDISKERHLVVAVPVFSAPPLLWPQVNLEQGAQVDAAMARLRIP